MREEGGIEGRGVKVRGGEGKLTGNNWNHGRSVAGVKITVTEIEHVTSQE